MEHIVSFLLDGQSFVIHDPVAFAQDVMPQYFGKMGSYASFQRQLNLYNFVRHKEGSHRGAYFHPRFVKGRPDLSQNMRRTKIKGRASSASKAADKTSGNIEMAQE